MNLRASRAEDLCGVALEVEYRRNPDRVSGVTVSKRDPDADAWGRTERIDLGKENLHNSSGGGTLSGLLRATHHSGPSAEPPASPDDFDPEATVSLDRFPADTDVEATDPEPAEDGESDSRPKRSGFFGRRK